MQEAAGASEKEPLVVTFTVTDPNTFALKADTMYADIKKAANAGRIVYAFVPAPAGPAFGQLSDSSSSYLYFGAVSGVGAAIIITMKSDSDIHGVGIEMLYCPSSLYGGGPFSAKGKRISNVGYPLDPADAVNKVYADEILTAGNGDSVVIKSSTPNSTKKFRITVDDAGAITATEVV